MTDRKNPPADLVALRVRWNDLCSDLFDLHNGRDWGALPARQAEFDVHIDLLLRDIDRAEAEYKAALEQAQ